MMHRLPLRGGLCLVVGLGLFLAAAAFAPPAARAQVQVMDAKTNAAEAAFIGFEGSSWAKNLGYLADIINGVNSLKDTTSDWFDKLTAAVKSGTAIDLASQQAYAEVRKRMTQAEIDSSAENTEAEILAEIRAKKAQVRHEHLCKAIMVHQLATTTEEFERAVSRMVVDAIEGMYRGQGADGNGPQYGYYEYYLRCKNKFGSSLDFPDKCVDTSTSSKINGRKLEDADLNFCTITGGQNLEIPKMKSVTGSSYSEPDPQNTEQKFWLAGLYFCFNLAGPRPSPPYGTQMDSPEGAQARSQWNQCAAKQSGLIKACADLLAYYTRPNGDSQALINAQKDRCKAGDKEHAGITLPASFENCEKGLSPYQAQYLGQAMCKSGQYFIAQAMGGATDAQMMNTNVDCSMSWNLWKDTVIRKQNRLAAAAAGILDLDRCWKKVKPVR